MYDGTLTNAASTDEWYEDAVQLTSNDVGPSADDPLVPIGLS